MFNLKYLHTHMHMHFGLTFSYSTALKLIRRALSEGLLCYRSTWVRIAGRLKVIWCNLLPVRYCNAGRARGSLCIAGSSKLQKHSHSVLETLRLKFVPLELLFSVQPKETDSTMLLTFLGNSPIFKTRVRKYSLLPILASICRAQELRKALHLLTS